MPSPWTPEPQTYDTWLTEVLGKIPRITEDGRVRVTEQGVIRIIERFEIKWSLSPPGFSPWTEPL